jgi:transposase InsO family protein
METDRVAQRRAFVTAYASGQWSMSELCERFGVSRPTGYKWVSRGLGALEDASCAPAQCPHRTLPAIETLLVAARRQYGWGASKLVPVLAARHPELSWPARSTVNAILDRHGLLRKHRRRGRPSHPGAGALQTGAPNQVWPTDFKGQFKTGDGRYCFPLTVTDHYSRAVLLCRALSSTRTGEVRPAFVTLFRTIGLPDAIRTDNGSPFASTGLHGLAPLSVWWMQLGIVHQRIRPGHPQANGTHERMHRELKRETATPAAASRRAQQRRFDAFRRRYNDERPHEALAQRTPASRWYPSARPYPARITPPDYPAHFEVRRVTTAGTFRFRGQWRFLSHALQTHDIGLDEIADGLWNVVYYRTVLGRLDERTGRINAG